MPLSKRYVALTDLYVAYRKAKAEAFYENTHFNALAFTEFERSLHKNLLRLRERLLDTGSSWRSDLNFLGDYAYLPKSIDVSVWDDDKDGHFRALDPLEDWTHRYEKAKKRATGSLRLVIRPTVDFQVVSALWILKVGHLFDAAINADLSFGNRLRRDASVNRGDGELAPPNLRSSGLFTPYFSAYRHWREKGLGAMEASLERGESILAITMDIEQFYHRVSPRFLLRKQFLGLLNLKLAPLDRLFTELLLDSLHSWYESTPDYADRPIGAIPVVYRLQRSLQTYYSRISTMLWPNELSRSIMDVMSTTFS